MGSKASETSKPVFGSENCGNQQGQSKASETSKPVLGSENRSSQQGQSKASETSKPVFGSESSGSQQGQSKASETSKPVFGSESCGNQQGQSKASETSKPVFGSESSGNQQGQSNANETAKPVVNGGGTVIAAIVYFFCVICSYYVIKPIRGSLVLELGSEAVPVLNILSMASLIAANALYSYIVGRYKRDIFIPVITKFFVLCLIGFWAIFSFVYPISGAGRNLDPNSSMPTYKVLSIGFYYLWVNFFSLIAVSMFWSFMNDVFSVSQGRKLYAIIGYGGLIGGLAGSALTSGLAKVIGTNNLFLLAIALLYPSIWCMKYIEERHDPSQIRDENNVLRRPEHPPRPWDGFMSVCANPILICMAFEMLLYTFSCTMFFQQMNRLVETSFCGDERTRFIAGLYGKINFLSLVTQFFLTKLFMLLKNPIYGLLSMTLIQITGTAITFSAPSLTVISWVIIIKYAINYSTGRALRELVFIPLSHEEKYQGKGFIDTVVFRVGDGLSSLTLIGGLHYCGYGPWLNYTIMVSMLLQGMFITKAARIFASKSGLNANGLKLKAA